MCLTPQTQQRWKLDVHHDLVLGLFLGDETGGDEPVLDLEPLVTLELEDPAEIGSLAGDGRGGSLVVRVVGRCDNVSVARKLLLHGLEELLGVILVRQTLDGRERLSTISLLESYSMNGWREGNRGRWAGRDVGHEEVGMTNTR